MSEFEIHHYLAAEGEDVFLNWLESLADIATRARIEVRLARVERGLLGNFRYLNDGVSELKLDFGPGYRIYYGKEGSKIVILLCGGDKSTQRKDIKHAIEYWKDYQTRDD